MALSVGDQAQVVLTAAAAAAAAPNGRKAEKGRGSGVAQGRRCRPPQSRGWQMLERVLPPLSPSLQLKQSCGLNTAPLPSPSSSSSGLLHRKEQAGTSEAG